MEPAWYAEPLQAARLEDPDDRSWCLHPYDVPRSPNTSAIGERVCPHCASRFILGSIPRGVHLRCAACKGSIEGRPGTADRWLYPISASSSGSNTLHLSHPDGAAPRASAPGNTLATLPGEAGQADPRESGDTIGRYLLLGELGRGGMGVVFEAYDPELDRSVALKVLMGGAFASEHARARFDAEARSAAALSHPGIVRVYDRGLVKGQPWFTMDRIVGSALGDLLASHGPLIDNEAARILRGTALAVESAHRRGVVHRDLKPANLLIDCEGQPHITDFGLAKVLDSGSDLTLTDALLGTPAYMAPEVAAGHPEIDWTRADIFGLGATLFAALTAQPPVEAANTPRLIAAAAEGRHTRLLSLRPDVAPDLAAIVARAMDPSPHRRYASAQALAEDLDRYLSGLPTHARPEGVAWSLMRRLRRRKGPILTGVSVALALTLGLIASYLQQLREDAAREAAAVATWQAVSQRMASEPDRSEALFEAFATSPDNRGTRALAEAWLARGDALDLDLLPWGVTVHHEVTYDWVRALVEHPSVEIEASALLRIASWWANLKSMRTLGLILDRVEAEAHEEAKLLELRLLGALSNGDHDLATELWRRARDKGIPLSVTYADPRRLEPWLSQAERVAPIKDKVTFLPQDEHPEQVAVLTDKDGGTRALALTPTVHEVPYVPPNPALPIDDEWWALGGYAADMDQDGEFEYFAHRGGKRTLSQLFRKVDGTIGERPFHPAVPYINSEWNGPLFGDFDGDGKPEMAAAARQWSAYDLRIYEHTGGDGLSLTSRARGNANFGLRKLADPWGEGELLVSVEKPMYHNTTVFGEDDPSGPPSQLRIWRVRGGELLPIFTWRPPTVARLNFCADLDGDGREEILGHLFHKGEVAETMFVIWAGSAPDTFELSLTSGPQPMGARQLDADPALEIIGSTQALVRAVRQSELVILGRGSAPWQPPPLRLSHGPLAPPDGLVGDARLRAWGAASRLAQVGMPVQAAWVLEGLGELAGAGVARVCFAAAAQLMLDAGRPDRAAILFERAASSGDPDPSTWALSIEASLDAGTPDLAIAAAGRWRAADGRGPTGELAERLAVWRRAQQAGFDALDEAILAESWQIQQPLALGSVGGRPRITWAQRGQGLGTLPLEPTDGPFALFADLTVDTFEWGAVAALALRQGDQEAIQQLKVVGGGGVNQLHGICQVPGRVSHKIDPSYLEGSVVGTPFVRAPERIALRLSLTYTPGKQWRCHITLPDSNVAGFATSEGLPPPPGPDLALTLPSRQQVRGATMAVTFESLQIWGARPGRPSVTPQPNALQSAVQMAEEGDFGAAVEGLRGALGTEGPFPEQAAYLLRAEHGRWLPLLKQALGERYFDLFASFHAGSAELSEPDVRRWIIEGLTGLTVGPDAPQNRWSLLLGRARALAADGDISRAARDLDRWLEAWGALPAPRRLELAPLASAAHREAALVAAQQKAPARAMALAKESILLSKTPELARDHFVVARAWIDAGLEAP